MFRLSELRQKLNEMTDSGKSFKTITDELYPDDLDKEQLRPYLWRIARDGYEPQNNKLRERLNLVSLKSVESCPICNTVHYPPCDVQKIKLPVLALALAPVCDKCGIVHVAKHCTKHPKPTLTPAEQREKIIRRMVKLWGEARKFGITIEEAMTI
jgi:hypothetical protein